MALEDEVLAEIRPSPDEKEAVWAVARALMERLRAEAEEAGIPAEPLLTGSVDKDTFLRDPEIDAFVAFPPSTSREDLERWGLRLGEVLEERELRYAEHPYTRGRFQGLEAEVVPCYRLEEPSDQMTAVDRTPFHSEYVKARMEEGQRDQVRLLKRFAEGIDVYGAEARVQGLSGYLCELLVLKFGSFREVLEAAASWRPPVTVELDREGERRFPEPLVVVDPVDGNRNAASAVSETSLATFILAAKEYLTVPARTFFLPPAPPERSPEALKAEMERRGTAVLALVAGAPDAPEDVIYPQLQKAERALAGHLTDHGFRVLRSAHFLTDADWGLLVELERADLPPLRRHVGPPTWMDQAQDFLEKWAESPKRLAGPVVEGGRLVVYLWREETAAAGRVRRDLPSLSLGKNLDRQVAEAYRLLDGEAVADAHPDALARFLLGQLPWRTSPP